MTLRTAGRVAGQAGAAPFGCWEIPDVSGGFRWEKVIFHVKLPVLSFCRVLEICFFSLQNVAQRDSWYSSIFDEGQVRSLLQECQSKFSQISLWSRAVVKQRLLSKRLGKHQYPLPIGWRFFRHINISIYMYVYTLLQLTHSLYNYIIREYLNTLWIHSYISKQCFRYINALCL